MQESTNPSIQQIVYVNDLEPLYLDLCNIMQKYLSFETAVKVIYNSRSNNGFKGLCGECIGMDAPDGEKYLWDGSKVPTYQLLDKEGNVQWQAGRGELMIAVIPNKFVFNFFIHVLETYFSTMTCAWISKAKFHSINDYYHDLITTSNLFLDEQQTKYLQEAGAIAEQIARGKVESDIRQRFVQFNPMTVNEVEQKVSQYKSDYWTAALKVILHDNTTSTKMMELYDDLIIFARATLGSFHDLSNMLMKNNWGVYNYSLQGRVNRSNNLVITYQGDYRILQWETEHAHEFKP